MLIKVIMCSLDWGIRSKVSQALHLTLQLFPLKWPKYEYYYASIFVHIDNVAFNNLSILQ